MARSGPDDKSSVETGLGPNGGKNGRNGGSKTGFDPPQPPPPNPVQSSSPNNPGDILGTMGLLSETIEHAMASAMKASMPAFAQAVSSGIKTAQDSSTQVGSHPAGAARRRTASDKKKERGPSLGFSPFMSAGALWLGSRVKGQAGRPGGTGEASGMPPTVPTVSTPTVSTPYTPRRTIPSSERNKPLPSLGGGTEGEPEEQPSTPIPGANLPPEPAPGSPEGTEAVPEVAAAPEAVGAAGVAEEAVATGGLRSALGGALMGFGGGGGLRGAWAGLAEASPEAAAILGPAGWVLGGATAAYEGVNKIGDAIASQRQQGAYFQGILGGSNLAGQGQRLAQTGFRFSQLGNLSPAQSSALFQGVTSLDMTGNERNNAMQTAIQLYDRLGVTIQSSLQNITIAATNGNKELVGLADAITSVSQAAVQGGVNANVARQNFTNVSAVAAQTFQGSAVQAIASGITTAQTGLGNVLSNADLSGLTGTASVQQQAVLMNMQPSQYIGAVESGDQGLFGTGLNRLFQTRLGSLNLPAAVKKAAQLLGPSYVKALAQGRPTQDQMQDIIAKTIETDPNNLAMTLPALAKSMGLNLSDTKAEDLLLDWGAGAVSFNTRAATGTKTFAGGPRGAAPTNISNVRPPTNQDLTGAIGTYITQQYGDVTPARRQTLTKQAQAAITAMSGRKASDVPLTTQGANQWATYQDLQQIVRGKEQDKVNQQVSAAASKIGDPDWVSRALKNVEGGVLHADPIGAVAGLLGIGGRADTYDTQAKDWYLKNVVQGKHQRDSTLESVLGDKNINTAGTVFQVKTADGNKYATLDDLEKHYRQQVEAGGVTVATGAYKGRALSDIYNFQQGKAPLPTYVNKAEQTKLANEVKKDTRTDKNVVTIKLSPDFQKYFQAAGAGNVQIQGGNTAAGLPNASYPDQSPSSGSSSFPVLGQSG